VNLFVGNQFIFLPFGMLKQKCGETSRLETRTKESDV